MMPSRIPLWTLACLALLLSSIGTGHARGHAPVAGLITLCLGGETVTAAVDAEGRPTAPAPLCPDCVGLGLAVLSNSAQRGPAPRPALERPAVKSFALARHPAPRPPVRAPPALR